MRMLLGKDMKRIVFLIVLAGMFASGSALAAVRVIDLGSLISGHAVSLFGEFPVGQTSTDIYRFNLGHQHRGGLGASLVSLLTIPVHGSNKTTTFKSFDITAKLLEWHGTTLEAIKEATGPAVFLSNDLFRDYYEFTVTATPPVVPGFSYVSASYGGSLAIVPEPSMAMLVIGGFLSLAFLSRRRLGVRGKA
jgi:hypothetical protein